MNVGDGLRFGGGEGGGTGKGGGLGTSAKEALLGTTGAKRCRGHATNGYGGSGNVSGLEGQDHGHGDDGEIAMATGHLEEGGAAAGRQRWEGSSHHHLVGFAGRGHDVLEEVFGGNGSCGRSGGYIERAFLRLPYEGQLGSRIGMGEASEYGATVSNLRMAHPGDRLAEERLQCMEIGGSLDGSLAHQRAGWRSRRTSKRNPGRPRDG